MPGERRGWQGHGTPNRDEAGAAPAGTVGRAFGAARRGGVAVHRGGVRPAWLAAAGPDGVQRGRRFGGRGAAWPDQRTGLAGHCLSRAAARRSHAWPRCHRAQRGGGRHRRLPAAGHRRARLGDRDRCRAGARPGQHHADQPADARRRGRLLPQDHPPRGPPGLCQGMPIRSAAANFAPARWSVSS